MVKYINPRIRLFFFQNTILTQRKGLTLRRIKNTVQLTIGTSAFLKKFPNEDICEQWIVKNRWPNGIQCPHCGNNRIYRLEVVKRFKCSNCRRQFTSRTGSPLAESKISLQKWLMAVWILTSRKKRISAIELATALNVTQRTAWSLYERINNAARHFK